MGFRFSATSSAVRRTLRRARFPHPRRFTARPGGTDGTVMVKRPPAPQRWRNIAPGLRASRAPVGTPGRASPQDRQRHWLLVLQAKGIRYRFYERNDTPFLYVPPVAERVALHEILAFEQERPIPPLPQPMPRKGLYWYAVLIAMLAPWHCVRWDKLLSLSILPATPREWLTTAGLDAYRVSVTGEWWRAFTSLTLHADAAHLVSNLVMGVIFGIPLCRHTGVGFGFLLTVLAGALGNTITTFLRPASFLSQGFSTAVFASVGLLAAFAAAFAGRHAAAHAPTRRREVAIKHGLLKALVPLGAGLGILAMFGGSEAPRVDYLAHVMGLFSGILLGFAVAFGASSLLVLRGTPNAVLQCVSLVAALGLFAMAWGIALR